MLLLTFAKEVFWFDYSLDEKSPNLSQKLSDFVWISHKIWSEIRLNFTNLSLNIKVCPLLKTLSWQQERNLDLAMIYDIISYPLQGCQRTIVPKEKRTQLSKRGFFTSKKDIFSISFNDIFQWKFIFFSLFLHNRGAWFSK